MIPKQILIEVPLLQVLSEMPGGEAKPADIYPRLEKRFPELTKEDLAEQLDSGDFKWKNRVQWVRQSLISKGEMSSPGRGIWAITDRGRARIAGEKSKAAPIAAAPLNLVAPFHDVTNQARIPSS